MAFIIKKTYHLTNIGSILYHMKLYRTGRLDSQHMRYTAFNEVNMASTIFSHPCLPQDVTHGTHFHRFELGLIKAEIQTTAPLDW